MATRAVVIGASVAGLLAARVLADTVDEVVLVERDELPDGALPRPGVPHAVHAHILLRRGYLELMRLYPAFDRHLAEAGAVPVDLTRDGVYITPGGEAPRFTSSLRSRAASRVLFEAVLRELTLQRSNVRVLGGHEVLGLIGDAAGVRGVRVRRRATPTSPEKTRAPEAPQTREESGVPEAPEAAEVTGAGVEELSAWLVVDASGRNSRTPALLREIGGPALDESVVDASLRYATRIYRVPQRRLDWKILLVRDRPPMGTRGGGVFPLEGDRWVVTLGGAGADHPPTDEAGYLEFSRTLISSRLFEAIRDAEPLTPIRGWARTANRWRHVEKVEHWPAGFALLGDSLCALNPVYGQGMSVAAMEARVLDEWLGSPAVASAMQAARPPDTAGLVRSLARTARLPWFMATAEDAVVPGVQGAPHPGFLGRLAGRYLDEIHLNAARDRQTLRRFTEVSQLVRPPIALLDPVVVWRVARGAASRVAGSARA